MSEKEEQVTERATGSHSDSLGMPEIPITTRLSIEIPKPRDWQAFQRNCVLLFRDFLGDPHVQEYGRQGQNQKGIDLIGFRSGDTARAVGVQCRLVVKPLSEAEILADARAALSINAEIKELIFATTAPDNTKTADAAIAVTKLLNAEGHKLRVVVYGWGQMQGLISLHLPAYYAFHPGAAASMAPQHIGSSIDHRELGREIAARLIEDGGFSRGTAPPREGSSQSDEDPTLHARIDSFRDIFRVDKAPLLAEKRLLDILTKEDLSSKPWARYRLETNLGLIAVALGREEDAATRFEAAHAIRPEDPNALTNLALARTIQGRFDEAIEAARSALQCNPPPDYAVSYLLQAAARSNWNGDPSTLIPKDLIGSSAADIGLAEFSRIRKGPNWAKNILDLSRRHPDVDDFKRLKGIAVLSLAVDSKTFRLGGQSPISISELNAAADDMKALAESHLDMRFAHKHDLMAYINNGAVLLRLCGRHTECEALLIRGLTQVDSDPQLRRLLALTRSSLDRDDEAISDLEDDTDPENQILRADLQASIGEISDALSGAISIKADAITISLQQLRFQIIGETALRTNDRANVQMAIDGLRSLDAHDVSASLFEIRAERGKSLDLSKSKAQLRALLGNLPNAFDLASRYQLAAELMNHGLSDEASQLLEAHVDLARVSPLTTLYLESLAVSRRDAALRSALARCSSDVRNAPTTLWTIALHAWNLGNLTSSLEAVDGLLKHDPNDPRARHLKIEIFIRQNRSTDLFKELDKPIEKLKWRRSTEQFRLATLLGHFGYVDRAADWAYRLFVRHRNLPRAWMTLSMLILDEGMGNRTQPVEWNLNQVNADAAIDLQYEDGSTAFFIVEPDPELRRYDPESWEEAHILVKEVTGKKKGDSFVGRDGRKGTITRIRHKYIARLHFVMENYNSRFPNESDFKKIPIDPSKQHGFDSFIAELKARHDWVKDEESQYINGPTGLGVLSHRLGMDTIEVAMGLAGNGVKLKVAVGHLEERESAIVSIRSQRTRGCVLDLQTFWTAWRLNALAVVQQICGPLHLPQSVLDRLRQRKFRFRHSAEVGHRGGSYKDGKVILHETSAEDVRRLVDDTDRAISWIEGNVQILPVEVGDDLPASFRHLLKPGKYDFLDSIVLARRFDLTLISDDIFSRSLCQLLGAKGGTWLHIVFGLAREAKLIDFEQFVRWSANLIDFGQNYLGVSGDMLAEAARLDARDGDAQGYLFTAISKMIGGPNAEAVSHTVAVKNCIEILWSDDQFSEFCRPITGELLRQLVRQRHQDYRLMLSKVFIALKQNTLFTEYARGWLKGHFLSLT